MGKNITIPNDYQPANNTCGTLTQVSGNNYNGADITTSQVKSALGEGFSNVGGLCMSNKVNKWAAFKSGTVTASASNGLIDTYTYNYPTQYKLGDFIGYNPNAKPPVYYVNNNELSQTISIQQGRPLNLNVVFARGEMNPVYAADKELVDMQYYIDSGTPTHERFSLPSVGNTITKNITSFIMADCTLYIKPVYQYYVGEGVYQDIAVIEDGVRTINIDTYAVPIYYTGTLTSYGDLYSEMSPYNIGFNWSLRHTATNTESMWVRIRIYGDNVNTTHANLGYLNFTSNELKSGTEYINVGVTNYYQDTVVQYELQVADAWNSDFAYCYVITSGSFNWYYPSE